MEDLNDPEDVGHLLPEDRAWLVKHGWRDPGQDHQVGTKETADRDCGGFYRLYAGWCVAVWSFAAICGVCVILVDDGFLAPTIAGGFVATVSTLQYFAMKYVWK